MAIPVVGLAFLLFGMWMYIALQAWPVGSPTVSFTTGFEPWSEKLAPNLSDRITGVFWAAFALFGMTAASIVSGSIIERAKTTGFLIIAVYVGAVSWVIPAAWGWSGNGWMAQYLGFHDQYCSAVLHLPAGFAALGVLLALGPRIGKFGPDGKPREIPAHNPWMVTLGIFMIYVGFFGFYAACHIPIANVAAEGQTAYWTTTNIYGVPITLSGVTLNFLFALFGGMITAYMISNGNAFWTYSGGLTGLISASAGNDLYHPILALAIAVVGTIMAYNLHNFVERKFKIDDAVGAVAVHGYCGLFGGIVAGFALWGYPAVMPSAGTLITLSEGAGWSMSQADTASAGWSPFYVPAGASVSGRLAGDRFRDLVLEDEHQADEGRRECQSRRDERDLEPGLAARERAGRGVDGGGEEVPERLGLGLRVMSGRRVNQQR